MTTIDAPRAARSPAMMALCWPVLVRKLRPRMLAWRSQACSIICHERSLLQSFTRMISYEAGAPGAAMACAIRRVSSATSRSLL